ncbi:YdcF family protein [Rhizobium sp. EC-SD404]|uniref:YdcF family protein n=1 Tax=Rhizobium sp. EC-SD404 TaxID=2038389 RepID=UPI0012546EE0|nr:YdcF family protein [Rhizobium sp. EC-SD404]VVT29843.1 conserved hypothetical protein [Rhizobium sp. EC-SD404]
MVEVSTNGTTPPAHDTAPPRDHPQETPVRARGRADKWARRFVSLILFVFAAVSVLSIGGFLQFADQVAALQPPEQIETTDAIVVLTGGSQRIDHGVSLFNEGVGKRMLISGVNPRTSGATLKSMTAGSDELFDCCVDIGYDAIDTIGNANETARWIAAHGFSRVLIVTSNYHVPRSLLELRRADPVTAFDVYPVTLADLRGEDWLLKPEVMRVMIGEYAKYAWAWVRATAGTKTATGLRTDQAGADLSEEDGIVSAGAAAH